MLTSPVTGSCYTAGMTSDTAPETPETLLQLRVTLRKVRPVVWRSLLVPDTIMLYDLHLAIQSAMNWMNCHTHAFKIAGIYYATPFPDVSPASRTKDENSTRLVAALGNQRKFIYDYDCLDRWIHDVRLMGTIPADGPHPVVVCTAGANAAPPEAVGGAKGYRIFRKIIANPAHPEYQAAMDFASDNFDPGFFDINRTNQSLAIYTIP